jgi:endoglucanase
VPVWEWSLPEVLAPRPAVRINQVGYLPGHPMAATWISDDVDPVEFRVLDGRDQTVFRGRSQPWPIRPDPTSGLATHVVDFTGTDAHGPGYRVDIAGHRSHPFTVDADLYAGLVADALRVFTLLRSGTPIPDAVAPGYGRPAGHVGHPPNRGDVAVPAWAGADADRVYPGWRCSGTFDVSGGWYDAGDYGKYVTSGSIAAWQLLTVIDWLARPGATHIGSLAEAIRQECRWQLDWLLRMQVPSPDPLAGMAFHRVHGTRWPPLPGPPHEDPTVRALHRPSTSATLHLAAVAAQGARVFRTTDPTYADRLVGAARSAHRAAHRHPDLPAPTTTRATTSTGPPPSCGWPPASPPTAPS